MNSEGTDISTLVNSKGKVSLSMDEALNQLKENAASSGQSAPSSDDSGEKLPVDESIGFVFASGAGAWGTGVAISADGEFKGSYHDSEMGETGDDYPNGTIYVSNFSGKFKNIQKIDDYTYKMELDYYDTDNEPGTDEIREDIHYVYSEPYGISGGKVFYLYLPGKPVSELNKEFIGWSYGVIGDISNDSTLKTYGLYNEAMGEGFFVY